MSNEGSLFVVVIAPIEGVEKKCATGLTVALGGKRPVPIGHLTWNFVTSQCTAFAGMPRVFIFIDPEVTANYVYKVIPVRILFINFSSFLLIIFVLFQKDVLKLEQVPEGNNHADFLVFVGFGKGKS